MGEKKENDNLKDVFSSNIRRLMEEKDINKADLSRALNIPFTTVSDWVNGKKYPRMDKVQVIADFFGVMKSELTEEKTPLPEGAELIDFTRYKKIPILGRIAAGMPIYAEQNIEGYTLTDLNHGAEYFSLRVRGDSMNAAQIIDGGLVIVRRQEEVESGEVAVVMVGDADATVKRFYRTGTTVTLMPQSTNSEHRPQIYDISKTTVRVLGKVVKSEVEIK